MLLPVRYSHDGSYRCASGRPQHCDDAGVLGIGSRGFLAGVVRKKLGLNLVSEQTDKGRVYRIKDGKTSPAAPDRAKQAA